MFGQLKIGIIGAGFISGTMHVPSILKLGDRARIVALSDNRPDALSHMARYYGIEKTYTDPLKMLEENEFDIVHICTANNTHKLYSIAALRSGANVLCEKPLALNIADAREMFAEADKVGKMLIACQNNRFGPIQAIKKLYEEGELGEVYFTEIENIRTRGVPPWGRFHIAGDNGHGPLCDVGVHFLDATLFVLGNPKFKAVSASTFRKLADKEDATAGCRGAMMGNQPYLPRRDYDYNDFDVEDFTAGMIRFENGMQMQLRFTWASNLPGGDFYRMAGTKAGLTYVKHLGLDNPISIHKHINGELVSRELELPIKGTMGELGHPMLIEHVANVLQNNEECMIKREEMLNVVSIMDAFYRSADHEREVTAEELLPS